MGRLESVPTLTFDYVPFGIICHDPHLLEHCVSTKHRCELSERHGLAQRLEQVSIDPRNGGSYSVERFPASSLIANLNPLHLGTKTSMQVGNRCRALFPPLLPSNPINTDVIFARPTKHSGDNLYATILTTSFISPDARPGTSCTVSYVRCWNTR